MNILVLGSKGFIGSHCVHFFAQKHQVWECDVVMDYANERYIWVDATDPDFGGVFSSTPFDICINCSGAASVPDSFKNPQRDFLLNSVNVFKALEAIRQHAPSCRFLNLSSAAVYGNPETLPVRETQRLQPLSPYGYHKKLAEDISRQFHDLFRLRTCNIRIFSAYGPGLKKQLFWDLFQKISHAKGSVEMFGTGRESRDFIYVGDLVRAIDLVIAHAPFEGESINAGGGRQELIADVAALFCKVFGWDGDIRFTGDRRGGDPLIWEADISTIASYGYKQGVSLEQGFNYYKQWIEDSKLG